MLDFIPAPDLNGLNDIELGAELASLHTLHAAITKKLEAAKDQFKARGLTEIVTDHYIITADTSTKWILDQAGIKAEFGEDWTTKRSKLITTKSIRVKATTKLAKADAA